MTDRAPASRVTTQAPNLACEKEAFYQPYCWRGATMLNSRSLANGAPGA
jgi:hypothetical protein